MNESLKIEYSFEESSFILDLRKGDIWQQYNQTSSEDRQEQQLYKLMTRTYWLSRVFVTVDLDMVQDIQYLIAPGFCIWSRANKTLRNWTAMIVLRRRDEFYFPIIFTNSRQNWDSSPMNTKTGKRIL